jgi:hypothetical protein
MTTSLWRIPGTTKFTKWVGCLFVIAIALNLFKLHVSESETSSVSMGVKAVLSAVFRFPFPFPLPPRRGNPQKKVKMKDSADSVRSSVGVCGGFGRRSNLTLLRRAGVFAGLRWDDLRVGRRARAFTS